MQVVQHVDHFVVGARLVEQRQHLHKVSGEINFWCKAPFSSFSTLTTCGRPQRTVKTD